MRIFKSLFLHWKKWYFWRYIIKETIYIKKIEAMNMQFNNRQNLINNWVNFRNKLNQKWTQITIRMIYMHDIRRDKWKTWSSLLVKQSRELELKAGFNKRKRSMKWIDMTNRYILLKRKQILDSKRGSCNIRNKWICMVYSLVHCETRENIAFTYNAYKLASRIKLLSSKLVLKYSIDHLKSEHALFLIEEKNNIIRKYIQKWSFLAQSKIVLKSQRSELMRDSLVLYYRTVMNHAAKIIQDHCRFFLKNQRDNYYLKKSYFVKWISKSIVNRNCFKLPPLSMTMKNPLLFKLCPLVPYQESIYDTSLCDCFCFQYNLLLDDLSFVSAYNVCNPVFCLSLCSNQKPAVFHFGYNDIESVLYRYSIPLSFTFSNQYMLSGFISPCLTTNTDFSLVQSIDTENMITLHTFEFNQNNLFCIFPSNIPETNPIFIVDLSPLLFIHKSDMISLKQFVISLYDVLFNSLEICSFICDYSLPKWLLDVFDKSLDKSIESTFKVSSLLRFDFGSVKSSLSDDFGAINKNIFELPLYNALRFSISSIILNTQHILQSDLGKSFIIENLYLDINNDLEQIISEQLNNSMESIIIGAMRDFVGISLFEPVIESEPEIFITIPEKFGENLIRSLIPISEHFLWNVFDNILIAHSFCTIKEEEENEIEPESVQIEEQIIESPKKIININVIDSHEVSFDFTNSTDHDQILPSFSILESFEIPDVIFPEVELPEAFEISLISSVLTLASQSVPSVISMIDMINEAKINTVVVGVNNPLINVFDSSSDTDTSVVNGVDYGSHSYDTYQTFDSTNDNMISLRDISIPQLLIPVQNPVPLPNQPREITIDFKLIEENSGGCRKGELKSIPIPKEIPFVFSDEHQPIITILSGLFSNVVSKVTCLSLAQINHLYFYTEVSSLHEDILSSFMNSLNESIFQICNQAPLNSIYIPYEEPHSSIDISLFDLSLNNVLVDAIYDSTAISYNICIPCQSELKNNIDITGFGASLSTILHESLTDCFFLSIPRFEFRDFDEQNIKYNTELVEDDSNSFSFIMHSKQSSTPQYNNESIDLSVLSGQSPSSKEFEYALPDTVIKAFSKDLIETLKEAIDDFTSIEFYNLMKRI